MTDEKMIAPCGMDCRICRAHLRDNNKCPGCRLDPTKISCLRCKIRSCTERTGKFCYDCAKFPCDKLIHLDKRYREKYGMSEIANLEFIRDHGIEQCLERQDTKWISDEGVLCVHDKKLYPK